MKQVVTVVRSLIVTAILIGFDQLTKYMALAFIPSQGHLDIIRPVLALELTYNRGISWGMLQADSRMLFAAITTLIGIVVLAIGYSAYYRITRQASIIAELLIVAGACGNLIDRVVHGAVIDFISSTIFGWDFPIFNVADMYIVLGVALYVYRVIRVKE
jgi:signal peptidase II